MMRQMDLQNFAEFFFPTPQNKLKTPKKIDKFDGDYDFLNNQFLCEIYFENILYKSVAFAYQAAKCTDLETRQRISAANTMEELYQISATIQEPIEFLSRRLRVMEGLLRDKFRRNKELKEKLLLTENRELINSQKELSSDNIFYGVVQGNGQNYLGKLLEQIRFDIVNNIDLDRWVRKSFNPEINPELIPKIIFEVIKESQIVETIILEKKPIYVLGSLTENDVYMAHVSISRIHAVLLVDKALGICIIDVGSKGGTFLDGQRIKEHWPVRIKTSNILNFAFSTRNYSIKIDEKKETNEINYVENRKKLEIDKKVKQELGTLLKKISISKKDQNLQKQNQENSKIMEIKEIDLGDQFIIQQINNEVSGDNNSDFVLDQKDCKQKILPNEQIKDNKKLDKRKIENQNYRKRSKDQEKSKIKKEYRSSSKYHHYRDSLAKKKYQSRKSVQREKERKQLYYKAKSAKRRRQRSSSYRQSKRKYSRSRSKSRRRYSRSRNQKNYRERSHHYQRHSQRNYSNYYKDYYFNTKKTKNSDQKEKNVNENKEQQKRKSVIKEKDEKKWLKQIDSLKEKIKKNNELKELQKKKEELKAKIIEKQNQKILNQV